MIQALLFWLCMSPPQEAPASAAIRVEVTRFAKDSKTFLFRVGEVGVGACEPSEAPLTGGPHRGLTRVMTACAPAVAEDGETFLSVRVHVYVYENPRDLKIEVGLFNDRLERAQGDVVAAWKISVFGKPLVLRGATTLYDGTGRWETPLGALRLAPQEARLREYSRELPELPLADADLEHLLTKQDDHPITVQKNPENSVSAFLCDRAFATPSLITFLSGTNRGQELYVSTGKPSERSYTLLESASTPIAVRDTFATRTAGDPAPSLREPFQRNGFWSARTNAVLLRRERAGVILPDLLAFVYLQARRPYHFADDHGGVYRFDRTYGIDSFGDGQARQPLFEAGRPQVRPYRETFGRFAYATTASPWAGYDESHVAVQEQACAYMLTGSQAARYELETIVETLAASQAMAIYPRGPCPTDLDAAWQLEAFDFAHFALNDPRYLRVADGIVQALDKQRGPGSLVLYPDDPKLKVPYVNSVDTAVLIGALFRHYRWGGSRRAAEIAKAFFPLWLTYAPLTSDDNGDGNPDRLTGWRGKWGVEHPLRVYESANPVLIGPVVLLALQYGLDLVEDVRASWCRDRLIELLLRTRVSGESPLAPSSSLTHAWACWALKNFAKKRG